MIKTNSCGNLIVVSGPSGAGKDTIINELKKDKDVNIWVSISMTSRLPRKLEEDGKDYFFVTKEEFEENIKNNNFLEYATYNGNYYGTPKSKIEEYLKKGIDVILIIEIQGAIQIKELIPDAVFIFIMPPSMEELKKRLTNRNTETPDKILERFKKAYTEINEVTKYNYVVVNDDVKKSCDKVKSILVSEKLRVDRIEEIYVNSLEEVMHEELVNKDFIN